MDWKTLPGYDEKYASVSIKTHKTFGGKVISVLYGAKDENGNAVMPSASKDDGHGEWFGIETEKGYRMFSLKHPASEGGAVEYGTDHEDHALEDMEADLGRKQELCKQASAVAKSGAADAAEKIAALKEEFAKVTNWETEKDAEYDEWFERATGSVEAAAQENAKNAEEKSKLVKLAEELMDSQDWKNTQQKFNDLFNQWKEVGRAGEQDDALWDAFRGARDKFNTARKEYFANLDASRAENKVKKEELIAKAKSAVENVKSYKDAGTLMNDLMESWKGVKSAGHDVDEDLWKQFNEIRQSFFAARKAFFEERDAQRTQSIDAKKALIVKAKELAEKVDYSQETTEAMKQLDVEWKKLGYSGREDNDKLWDEFKAAKDVFWNAKHEDSQKRLTSLIDRKEEQIKNLRAQANSLEEQVYETDDFDEQRSLQRQAADKKATIEDIKKDIESLKGKLDD